MIRTIAHLSARLLCTVALLVGSAPKAHGKQPESSPSVAESPATEPWNQGVTEEQKARAQPFFDEGNGYFERSMYTNALAEYRKAIEHRDHPAIRYNMAVCLMNLGQPIEAHENLVLAMQYGDAPLAEALHKQGKTYMSLLLGQLAKVRVVTNEKGAKISLDGKELFVGPGEATRMVKPESHQVTAVKADYLTHNEEFLPRAGGQENLLEIHMVSASEGLVTKRRWAPWKPWAVAGGGLAAAGIGVPLYLLARSNLRTYDDQLSEFCQSTNCQFREADLPSSTSDLKSRSKLQEVSAISLFAMGGAATAAGVVMLFLNRPVAERIQLAPPSRDGASDVRVSPILDGSLAGIMTSYTIGF